jgi:hypothetical protein
MKTKRCRCGQDYNQFTSLQNCCIDCLAVKVAKKRINCEKVAKKVQSRELKAAKDKIKTRSEWMRECQQVFNAYIRQRDADKPCISSGVGNVSYVSGRPKQTSWDAGHYRTVGSCPELRFNEFNVHKQSVHDNQHLHGNLIQYRIGLIQRIGLEKVEWLEGNHPPAKWTIDDLKEIKRVYKQKLKQLLIDKID